MVRKKGFERSEKEINSFIEQISDYPTAEIPELMSLVAVVHASLNNLDVEFELSLNAGLGERQKKISTQIVQTNGLMNDAHKNNQPQIVAAIKVWNMTLRCMSNSIFFTTV